MKKASWKWVPLSSLLPSQICFTSPGVQTRVLSMSCLNDRPVKSTSEIKYLYFGVTQSDVVVTLLQLDLALHLDSVGLPRWLSGKESACQYRRCGFDCFVRKTPWRKKWEPAPLFLSRKFCGQKSVADYSSWDPKELDTI